MRPLLEVLRVAGDVDGGLTAPRAVALLGSPHRDGRAADRASVAICAGRRQGRRRPDPHDLIAESLRDPELVAGADPETPKPVLSLAQILDRAREAWWPTVGPPVPILDQVWRATDWPQRLRRDALGAAGTHARPTRHSML